MKSSTGMSLGWVVLSLLLWQPLSMAEEPFSLSPQIKSPAAKVATDRYEEEKKKLDTTYQTVVRDIQDKYKRAVEVAQNKLKQVLEQARKDATVQDQLDDAVVIREVIQEVEQLKIELPVRDSSQGATASTTSVPLPPPDSATDETNPLAKMSIEDYQRAIAGRWRGEWKGKADGSEWIFQPNGTVTCQARGYRDTPVHFRYQDEKLLIAFLHKGHYMVLSTPDFKTLWSTQNTPFRVRRVPEENK